MDNPANAKTIEPMSMNVSLRMAEITPVTSPIDTAIVRLVSVSTTV